jgi:hypothetical protein
MGKWEWDCFDLNNSMDLNAMLDILATVNIHAATEIIHSKWANALFKGKGMKYWAFMGLFLNYAKTVNSSTFPASNAIHIWGHGKQAKKCNKNHH